MSHQTVTALSEDEKQLLLGRLEAMQIEPAGAERTFVSRLAQENGWRADFAGRVMHEYRRFLFLAATADHAVTPSDEVDQAWHLHLAYTRHYWDELCGRILGRPLHHGPTAGGNAEATRYRSQYAATLASYRAAFGSEPPPDIWPPERERFRADHQRVDRRQNWVFPKWPFRVAVAGAVAAGCAAGADEAGSSTTTIVIVLVVLLLTVAALLYNGRRHRRRRGGRAEGTCGVGCGSTGGSKGGGGDPGCGADGGGGSGGGCGGGCGD